MPRIRRKTEGIREPATDGLEGYRVAVARATQRFAAGDDSHKRKGRQAMSATLRLKFALDKRHD